ncbi:MAG: LamG-like jellyroll fold domain-containing protein [Phycisphaerae bacterium]
MMNSMRRAGWIFMVTACCWAAAPATADVVYKLTFDNPKNAEATAEVYVPARGDVVPKEADVVRLAATTQPACPALVASDGFQGGQAIQLQRPSDGSNCGYHIKTGPKHYELPPDGGISLEAIVFIDGYDPQPSSGVAGIVGATGVGGLSPDLALIPGELNKPTVQFSIAWHNQSVKYTPPQSLCGAWHHLAGVYTRNAGPKKHKIALFIDGKLVAEKEYDAHPYQTFVPVGFALGVNAPNATKGRVLQGKIDAIVITDDVRKPATFILPVTPPKDATPAKPATAKPATDKPAPPAVDAPNHG